MPEIIKQLSISRHFYKNFSLSQDARALPLLFQHLQSFFPPFWKRSPAARFQKQFLKVGLFQINFKNILSMYAHQ